MKKKLLFTLIIFTIIKAQTMEKPTIEEQLKEIPELQYILKNTASEEFIDAYKLVTGNAVCSLKSIAASALQQSKTDADEEILPEEVKEFANKINLMVKQIRSIITCQICSETVKEILLNFVNNPNFRVREYYPEYLATFKKYPGKNDFKKILNGILIIAVKKISCKRQI